METIGHDAAELAPYEHRRELGREDESDVNAAVGQLQGEPRHRDALHPRADRRNDLAEEEKPVVPVPERAKHPDRRGFIHG